MTSKENSVIKPVSGTVSQNTLPSVVRISCVVETIFRRYHQTMSFLAHLSRRLRGELIVYRSSRRPCMRACVR